MLSKFRMRRMEAKVKKQIEKSRRVAKRVGDDVNEIFQDTLTQSLDESIATVPESNDPISALGSYLLGAGFCARHMGIDPTECESFVNGLERFVKMAKAQKKDPEAIQVAIREILEGRSCLDLQTELR